MIPTEETEQESIAFYLDMIVGPLGWFHVPNGGHRHKSVAVKLKRQGVKAGVCDVIIITIPQKVRDNGYVGVVIEMKRVNMVPSDLKKNQREWLQSFDDNWWLTYVAKGSGDAIDFLKEWGF